MDGKDFKSLLGIPSLREIQWNRNTIYLCRRNTPYDKLSLRELPPAKNWARPG